MLHSMQVSFIPCVLVGIYDLPSYCILFFFNQYSRMLIDYALCFITVDVEKGSFKMDGGNNNLRKDSGEIAQDGNSSNGQSMKLKTVKSSLLNGSAEEMVDKKVEKCITPDSGEKQKHSISNVDRKVVVEKNMENGVDGIGFIQMEQLSPPFSNDSKEDGNSSDPSSNHKVIQDSIWLQFLAIIF